jgi:hypothetical protein
VKRELLTILAAAFTRLTMLAVISREFRFFPVPEILARKPIRAIAPRSLKNNRQHLLTRIDKYA